MSTSTDFLKNDNDPDPKEYIVTLKNRDDLDDFYDDMETPGGSLYIPDRSVDVCQRRHISRNTHYYLTDQEAEQLRQDSRVAGVSRPPKDLGIKISHLWQQTGNFEKSGVFSSTDKNWGLLRVAKGETVFGWGTNGLFSKITDTVTITSSGKNVDVVVVDAHIRDDHPEFAVNSDGTGGSRVNLFNWFSLSDQVGISTVGAYDYSNISANHGTHVAGTACGNTQGWARNANIYSMEFVYAGSNAPDNWELYIFDYLRAFHLNKPINPATGRRNPTITNHSWGYSYNPISLSIIDGHTYRGVFTNINALSTAAKKSSLESNGVPVPFDTYLYDMPFYYPALMSDVEDAINDGVIVVAAAGNSLWNCVYPGDIDYNNSVRIFGTDYYHSRGMSPSAGPTLATEISNEKTLSSICVGNVSEFFQEVKSASSNYGNRVDIWAPGSNIISAVYNSTAEAEFGGTPYPDPRNSNYLLGSTTGTSMASPQVCGILACYAEQNPNMTQQEALDYLIKNSKKDQIGSIGSDYGDYYWFGDNGNNRYLYFKLERQLEGNIFPRITFKNRPTSGPVFPRTRIRKTA
jgi:hypothetical protein